MNSNELQQYLADNSTAVRDFQSKATDFQDEKNQRRAPARRYAPEQIQREVDKMTAMFIDSIHEKIKGALKSSNVSSYDAWAKFIDGHGICEELEESVVEMEFA